MQRAPTKMLISSPSRSRRTAGRMALRAHSLMSLALVAIALFAVRGAAAQVTGTAPQGFGTQQGNSAAQLGQVEFFGVPITEGWTVFDSTRVGKPARIAALHLRASQSVPLDPASKPQKLRLHLRLGHADRKQLPASGPAQVSQLVTSWTTMHSGTQIDFPDLSQAPTQTPSPWSLRIPMPRPFAYNGQDAFALQCYAEPIQGTAPSYSFDGIDESRARSFGQGTAIGQGCSTLRQEIQVEGIWTVYADTRRTVSLDVVSHPAGSQFQGETLLLIGLSQLDIPLGFCTRLYSSAEFAIPMDSPVYDPQSQDYGRGATLFLPFDKKLVGLQLYLQSWGIDRNSSSLRLVGSRGFQTGAMPARPQPSLDILFAAASPTPSGHPDLVVLKANAGPILGLE